MSEEEQAVIEDAIEWANWRRACHYGPGGTQLKQAERALENSIDALHAEHDGQWRSP